MPELPEVERVRAMLAPMLLGRQFTRVQLRRPDVVHGPRDPKHLLQGARCENVWRHGKQLALEGRGTRGRLSVVCIHLGMSGSLQLRQNSNRSQLVDPHTHVRWIIGGVGELQFRDPRRFGGLWTFRSEQELREKRWGQLGPDALKISSLELWRGLGFLGPSGGTRRSLKAALLDQKLVAGLGNIYVDELLFRCRLHPAMSCRKLRRHDLTGLRRVLGRLLRSAILHGGSTIRTYVDSHGEAGHFQRKHHVYGRAGCPCHACGHNLIGTKLVGRTTVFCSQCQPL